MCMVFRLNTPKIIHRSAAATTIRKANNERGSEPSEMAPLTRAGVRLRKNTAVKARRIPLRRSLEIITDLGRISAI